jgi:eukaryotic-like serine/threonine-protein kinase
MELVEGRTLRSWMLEAPRSSDEIVAAFLQAGRGLAAAHEAGLLHRDFKPDNVFVARDGRVKVGDFGLAQVVGPGEASTGSAVAGTPQYLAPEVASGSSASPASDQFSFCVSLWECLYGRRPFSMPGELRVHPGTQVPPRLRRVASRGLAFDPADRHPSMGALVRALDRGPLYARPLPAIALSVATGLAALALLSYRAEPRSSFSCLPPPPEESSRR